MFCNEEDGEGRSCYFGLRGRAFFGGDGGGETTERAKYFDWSTRQLESFISSWKRQQRIANESPG